MVRRTISFPLLLLAACSGGDDPDRTERKSGQLLVYAVNYPLAYMAERIGGKQVRVEFPAPAGADPAYWKPGLEVIARYQEADLILLNGAGYAGWIGKVSLPPSALEDTSKAFRDRYVKLEEKTTHLHGPEGKHEHGEVAFTTWLDFGWPGNRPRLWWKPYRFADQTTRRDFIKWQPPSSKNSPRLIGTFEPC